MPGVDFNRYAYSGNDPVNGSDPSGHCGQAGNPCVSAPGQHLATGYTWSDGGGSGNGGNGGHEYHYENFLGKFDVWVNPDGTQTRTSDLMGNLLTTSSISALGRINLTKNLLAQYGLYRQLGLPLPAYFPPGVDIPANIRLAQSHANEFVGSKLLWFKSMVGYGRPWDYKTRGEQYEDFGNWHYGLVGAAADFSEGTLLRAAGTAQVEHDRQANPLWGVSVNWVSAGFGVGGTAPFGDDPVDQDWIHRGVVEYGTGDWND
jgi:Bacterial toxin 44